MPHKRTPRGKPAPLQLNHEAVQECLLAYCYGRLTPAEDAAVEAHVAGCKWCRAEGLRHLAAERTHALQQRPKTQHQSASRTVALVFSVCLVVALGLSGFLVVSAARSGAFHLHGQRTTVATLVPSSPTPTIVSVASPVALKAQTTVAAKLVDTLAWSPDGTQLATAAAPDPANGLSGGIVVYKNISSTLAGGPLLSKQLLGFEQVPQPGTLAWSPDGTMLAAAGHAHLFIWNVNTGQLIHTIGLPSNPSTALSVFDVLNAVLVMRAPSSIFLPSGLVQWGQNGTIQAAPSGAAGSANMPGAFSSFLALWGGQQGIRIFRDATNTTMIGTSDADVHHLASYLRWSPEGRYLVWGYPRVAANAVLLNRQHTLPTPTQLGMPDAAFVAAVHAVQQSTDPSASVEIWPTGNGSRLVVFDSTTQPATFTLVNAATDGQLDTLGAGGNTSLLLNQVSCQSLQPLMLAVVTQTDGITVYGTES